MGCYLSYKSTALASKNAHVVTVGYCARCVTPRMTQGSSTELETSIVACGLVITACIEDQTMFPSVPG